MTSRHTVSLSEVEGLTHARRQGHDRTHRTRGQTAQELVEESALGHCRSAHTAALVRDAGHRCSGVGPGLGTYTPARGVPTAVLEGARRLSKGMRQWVTPSVLRRLQALLILRACLSDQALVPSGSALGRLGQHDGVCAPECTRCVGGVGGMPFALITGARRCAPRGQGHAVGARGAAAPVHGLPGASAQFASLFLALMPRHVRRSGGFSDTGDHASPSRVCRHDCVYAQS
jgi:hypothetical protein